MPRLRFVYNLLSKPIYSSPPGMKPSQSYHSILFTFPTATSSVPYNTSGSSPVLFHSQQHAARFQTAKLVLGAKCFSQRKSPRRKTKKERGKGEPGRTIEQRFKMATSRRHISPFANYANDSRRRDDSC